MGIDCFLRNTYISNQVFQAVLIFLRSKGLLGLELKSIKAVSCLGYSFSWILLDFELDFLWDSLCRLGRAIFQGRVLIDCSIYRWYNSHPNDFMFLSIYWGLKLPQWFSSTWYFLARGVCAIPFLLRDTTNLIWFFSQDSESLWRVLLWKSNLFVLGISCCFRYWAICVWLVGKLAFKFVN